MAKTVSDLKVGDVAWFTDVNGRPKRGLNEIIITKIGRVLIHAENRVFRKDTMRANDDYGHQTLILSKADHIDAGKRHDIRILINNRTLYSSRCDAPLEDLIAAAKLLGIDVGEYENG